MQRISNLIRMLGRWGFVVLLLGLTGTQVIAQPPAIAWQTDLYTDLGCSGQHVVAMPDSEYVVAGWVESPTSGSRDMMLARISDRGYLEIVRFYGEGEYGSLLGVTTGPDRSLFAVGHVASSSSNSRDIEILHTSINGEPIWERRYGGEGDQAAYAICPSSEDGYYVAGRARLVGSDQYQGFVLRISPQGDSLNSYVNAAEDPSHFNAVTLTTDGGAIAAGSISRGGTQSEDILVSKIDSELGQEWTVSYGGSGLDRAKDILMLPNGGFVICGQTASEGPALGGFVMICNANGDSLTSRTFSGGLNPWSVNSIALLSSDTIVVAGATGSTGSASSDGFVCALDTNLAIIWLTYTEGGDADELNGIAIGSNSRIQAVGSTLSFGTSDLDLYYTSLSPNGEITAQGNYGGTHLGRGFASTAVPGLGLVVARPVYGGVSNGRNINSISEIDSDGNLMWQLFLDAGYFDAPFDVRCSESDVCYLVGSRAAGLLTPSDYLIQAVGSDGGLLWETTFGDASDEWIGRAAVLSDSRIVTVLGSGDESESQARLGIFSADGEYLNEMQATDLPDAILGDIDAFGGHICLLGTYDGTEGRNLFISMYDTSFQHLWTRTRERTGTGYSTEIHLRDDLIIATSIWPGISPLRLFHVDRLNTDGDSIGHRNYDVGIYQSRSTDVTHESGLITPALGEGNDHSVERLSVSGETVWTIFPDINSGGVNYLDDRSIRLVGSVPESEIDITRIVATYPEDLLSSSPASLHVKDFNLAVFPNPFNSTLSIALDVPLHQEVNVSLYDLLGREVEVIYRGRLASTSISYVAPVSLSSGVYFVRAASVNSSVMQKVVLLK